MNTAVGIHMLIICSQSQTFNKGLKYSTFVDDVEKLMNEFRLDVVPRRLIVILNVAV